MSRIRMLWGKYKKLLVYISLAIIMVYQLISLVVPDFFNINVCLLVICGALIMIFEHINDLYDSKHKSETFFSMDFSEGFTKMLLRDKKIKELDIFAESSMQYYYTLKNLGLHINKLRLLVCIRREEENAPVKRELSIIQSRNRQVEMAISFWTQLQKDGQIDQLTIRVYEYEPSFHYSILNGKYFHTGLFKLQENFPNILLSHHTFLTLKPTSNASALLNDLKFCFSQTFNNYSKDSHGFQKND